MQAQASNITPEQTSYITRFFIYIKPRSRVLPSSELFSITTNFRKLLCHPCNRNVFTNYCSRTGFRFVRTASTILLEPHITSGATSLLLPDDFVERDCLQLSLWLYMPAVVQVSLEVSETEEQRASNKTIISCLKFQLQLERIRVLEPNWLLGGAAKCHPLCQMQGF